MSVETVTVTGQVPSLVTVVGPAEAQTVTVVGPIPAPKITVTAGTAGPAGTPGPAGGPAGPAGQPRFVGQGPPGTVIGASPGDCYLDEDSGLIYTLG